MYKRHKLERSEGKSEATSAVRMRPSTNLSLLTRTVLVDLCERSQVSTEMKALNSQFGVAHGTSSILVSESELNASGLC